MDLQEVLSKLVSRSIDITLDTYETGWTITLQGYFDLRKETFITLDRYIERKEVKTHELAETIHEMILEHLPGSDYVTNTRHEKVEGVSPSYTSRKDAGSGKVVTTGGGGGK